MDATSDSRQPSSSWVGWTTLAALAAIILLGAALRFYRLDEQSVWRDEYLAICNLEAKDLVTYLRLSQLHLPEQAAGPLYYAVQYYWVRCFGDETTTLRSLPILISLVNIALAYMLGARFFGRRVG